MSLSIHRGLLISGGILGFLGVLAGTFGAHGLKARLSADLMADFEIGVRYQLVHAAALLAAAIIAGSMARRPGAAAARAAGWCMTVGVVIFSGSLYALALTGQNWMGMVTPFGGASLLAGWALLTTAAWRMRSGLKS